MKSNCFLFTVFLLITFNSYAQPDFRPGYIIDFSGDTISGMINYQNAATMSRLCSFRATDESLAKDYAPGEIKEFRFENGKCFVSRTLDDGKNVFLEFLIKGKLNVYYYRDVVQDKYMIEKEGMPLKLIPYRDEITVKDDGTEVRVKSKSHVGLLKVYTQDVPEIQKKSELIIRPEHNNLIKFARNYHQAVCSDESCIIYAKDELPVLKVSLEPVYSYTTYTTTYFDMDIVNEFGVNVYFWMPRVGENFYFRTGYQHCFVSKGQVKGTSYGKIPLHIHYQYSHFRLRPGISLGINTFFFEPPWAWTMTLGGGLNFRVNDRLSLSSGFMTDFIVSPKNEVYKIQLYRISYAFSIGLRIEV